MRRIRIAGLCLVAVFAMTAVAASSASAALPELYECAKLTVKPFKGKYTDKACSVKATEAQETEGKVNKYELQPGVGKGKVFKGKGKVATLYTPKIGGEVSCKTNSSEGKNASPSAQTGVTAKFKTCTSLGKKCSSTGHGEKKAGEIYTNPLQGKFGYISKSPLKVGVSLEAEGGLDSADFTCEGLVIETKGAVIGEITGNVNSFNKTSNNIFTVTEGSHVQIPTKFEGGPEEVLQTTINGSGPFPSGQDGGTIVVKGENLMLKA